MYEPSNAFCPAEDPGPPSTREQSGRPAGDRLPGLPDASRCSAPSAEQRLAELQEERNQMSGILRHLPKAVEHGGELARRLFLDIWCARVLEIETEMDRLRAALHSPVGVPPLEARLIRWVFTERWRYARARRRGSARPRPRRRSPQQVAHRPPGRK